MNESVAKPESKHTDKTSREKDTRKKAHHTAIESNPFCARCGQDHPFAKTRWSNLQVLRAQTFAVTRSASAMSRRLVLWAMTSETSAGGHAAVLQA